MSAFPIGQAMKKNLTIRAGNCHHRKYAPQLVNLVRTGAIDPSRLITQVSGLPHVLDAYEHFNQRHPGWTKVELKT